MYDETRRQLIRDAVTRIVNQTDPEGLLAMGAPDDEYDEEINEIIQGLADAWPDSTRVAELVQEVFERWFGITTRPRRTYLRLAGKLCLELRDLQEWPAIRR